jgi:hypothetical protein
MTDLLPNAAWFVYRGVRQDLPGYVRFGEPYIHGYQLQGPLCEKPAWIVTKNHRLRVAENGALSAEPLVCCPRRRSTEFRAGCAWRVRITDGEAVDA